MKILIVGCGSIGQRHAKNIAAIADVSICDSDGVKLKALSDDLDCPQFSDIDDALKNQYDGIIIALPNKFHYDAAIKALKTGAFVLVEKPLCHTLEQAEKLVELGGDRLFVVSNMRYHQAILALGESLTYIGKPLFARAQFGNYLPNMRPGVDYRKLYVAKREDGGGVLMDCIHELDYLGYLFGPAVSVSASLKKISDLEIQAEDYASLQIGYESGVQGEVHLDYLQQIKQRGCEIVGTNGTIIWKSVGKNPEHCFVKYYSKNEDKWTTLVDTTNLDVNECYVSLVQAFCNVIAGDDDGILAVADEGLSALKIVYAAYASSETGAKIDITPHEKNHEIHKKQKNA